MMSHPVPACIPAGRRLPRSRAPGSRAGPSAPPAPAPSRQTFGTRPLPAQPRLGAGRGEPGAGSRGRRAREGPAARPARRPAPPRPARGRGARTHQYAEPRLRAADPARRRLWVLKARGHGQAPPRSQQRRERVRVHAAAAGEHQAPACQDVGGGGETCDRPGSSSASSSSSWWAPNSLKYVRPTPFSSLRAGRPPGPGEPRKVASPSAPPAPLPRAREPRGREDARVPAAPGWREGCRATRPAPTSLEPPAPARRGRTAAPCPPLRSSRGSTRASFGRYCYQGRRDRAACPSHPTPRVCRHRSDLTPTPTPRTALGLPKQAVAIGPPRPDGEGRAACAGWGVSPG